MSMKTYEFGYSNGRKGKNFCVNIFAHGCENLGKALEIVFCDIVIRSAKSATHYLVDEKYGLVFFHDFPEDGWKIDGLKVSGAKEFNPRLEISQITDFAWNWLQKTEYRRDENDGDSIRGWHLYNEEHGIVGDCLQAVAAVKPLWIYLGK